MVVGRIFGQNAPPKRQPTFEGSMNTMATLSIGKAHFSIGAHEQTSEERPGFISSLSRFMVSAQAMADKYADYKYNDTDWRSMRP